MAHDRPLSETSDWEEQDLLTLDEAGQRLAAELDVTQAELEQARAAGDDTSAGRLEQRLAALALALERVAPTA